MLYSLMLIVLIPLAIFFNTYYITANFQQNFDKVFTSPSVELAAVIDNSVTVTR